MNLEIQFKSSGKAFKANCILTPSDAMKEVSMRLYIKSMAPLRVQAMVFP